MTAPAAALSAHDRRALFALALGAFVISTSEFAAMGLLPLYARDLSLSLPQASWGIAAYAVGVALGAPLLTAATARVHRAILLLGLMVLAFAANALTAFADGLPGLIGARFASGLPQGVYFGAASVAAIGIVGKARGGHAVALVLSGISAATVIGAPAGAWIGQSFGWRTAFGAIGLLGLVSAAAILAWIPRGAALRGGPVMREVRALAHGRVWFMLGFASLSVAGMFSVYTFIGPLTTEVAGLPEGMIPVGQLLVGLGIGIGTLLGGRIADRSAHRGMLAALGCGAVALAVMALSAAAPAALLALFFLLGLALNSALPSITLNMMRQAPEAPVLMGALNMAAFNIANAIGAGVGGGVVEAGLGLRAPIWAGAALTAASLGVFALFLATRGAEETAEAEAAPA